MLAHWSKPANEDGMGYMPLLVHIPEWTAKQKSASENTLPNKYASLFKATRYIDKRY